MWTTVFLLALSLKSSLSLHEQFLLNNSNCSISFHIQTISQSNKIQTNFPIEFRADYNLTCDSMPGNLTAYYKITPLAILVVGKYKNPDENIKSMIEINSSSFNFNINQSSTIRLCVLSSDEDDNDDEGDTDYRVCRQIHIGISMLYDFWNLPIKVFYISLICSVSVYYLYFLVRERWRKGGKRPKLKPVAREIPVTSDNRDTFENEKINEEEVSGEEDDE